MKTARILVMADDTVPAFYDYYRPGVFDGIDLIISCGDLPARYLSFIATLFKGDVLYVPGNHDERFLSHPPEGCICIDDRIFVWKGLRILGLGGSFWYKPGPYQYSEEQMKSRIRRLRYQLWRRKGFDLLVTHAPARGHNDGCDLPHRGFECFLELIEKYKPKYFVHGHVHMNYGSYPRFSMLQETAVINAYQRFVIEVPVEDDKLGK
ncbi:MAG: metallophosphoesterase [Erysipelotrichaceae bacterium]|nr:metallophosphoesterase [Erysipelotrichaceae bacterium]